MRLGIETKGTLNLTQACFENHSLDIDSLGSLRPTDYCIAKHASSGRHNHIPTALLRARQSLIGEVHPAPRSDRAVEFSFPILAPSDGPQGHANALQLLYANQHADRSKRLRDSDQNYRDTCD